MAWNSTGSFINMLCQWLITVFVVRIAHGYDAAGIYSLATSVYGIFHPIAQYRMYTYQVTDVAGEHTTGEYLSFRLITNGIAFVLCFGYSILTCPKSSITTIMLYAVYRLAALVIDVFHACDQKNNRMDYIGISLGIQGLTSLTLFGICFFLFNNLPITFFVMTIGLCIIGFCYDYPRTKSLGSIQIGISFSAAKKLLLACAPLVAGAIAASASGAVPRQYLLLVAGESALGIYSSVAAPVAVIPIFASYIYYPLISHFSKLFHDGDMKAFRALLYKAALAIIGTSIGCSIILFLFGEKLLVFIFSNDIENYVYLLQPLLLAAVFSAFMWFANDLLIALRDIKGDFMGGILAFIIAALTTVPLVNEFGMNGINYCVIVSMAISAIFMIARVFFAKRSTTTIGRTHDE